MPIAQPYKKQLLLDMLAEGMVMLHLDARHPDVEIPEFLKDDFQLRLNLSYRFADVNLSVDDEWIRATLSFQRIPFACVLPLQAVWGVSSQDTRLQVFPHDLPEELAEWFMALAHLSEDMDESEEEPSTPDNVSPLYSQTETTSRRPHNIPHSPRPQAADTSASSSRERAPKRPALQLVVDNTKEETTESSLLSAESDAPAENPPLSVEEKRARFRVIEGSAKNPSEPQK